MPGVLGVPEAAILTPDLSRIASIEDLRRLAKRRLPSFVMSYVETGAGDGGTNRRNIEAFRRRTLLPHVLGLTAQVDASHEIFGQTFSQPFGISAVGACGICRRHADEMLADAARDANIPFILSGVASASIETIARRAPNHVWYQLYGSPEPDLTDDMVRRAKDAGAGALVFTVDYPVPPRSQVSIRTGVSLALGPDRRALPRLAFDAVAHPGWTFEFLRHGGAPSMAGWEAYAPPGSRASDVARVFGTRWLGPQTWRDLDRVRRLWPGPLVLKGIVHPDDAVQAFAAGVDAVTVSNHGGNKLDCMPPTLESLAAIRQAVGPTPRVFFDGGLRRGSDLVVARALGADFCFLGRATLYGVAAAAEAGARKAVTLLSDELAYVLAMLGRSRWAGVGPYDLAVRSFEGVHAVNGPG